MINKIIEKIINSKQYYEKTVSASRHTAALTLHCFDNDLVIEECHNAREFHVVIFRGQEINRIHRDEFDQAIKDRKSKLSLDFMNS